MVVPVADTLEILDDYLEALTQHTDFARFFTDDVEATLESKTPEIYRGRQSVHDWILGAHALGEVKVVSVFACGAHAAGEFDFIRKDGVKIPYTVMYDFRDQKISALRLFFTGPIA